MVKLICVLSIFSFYCLSVNAQSASVECLRPRQFDYGLSTRPARSAGFDINLLKELSDKIDKAHYQNIHSVLVLHRGQLIYEKYSGGYERSDIHTVRSISKFVTSALIGIAVDQGHIRSVEDRIFDYLPHYQKLKTSEKNEIRIKHLLSMTAGLQWRESDVLYGTDENDETQMYRYGEWVRYTLSKPMVHAPGSKWEYSGGLANLMGVILQNATEMPVDDYARQYLLQPLGIENFQWRKHRDHGWVSAAAGVSMTPRALAKIGRLYLDHGRWDGKEVLSEDWVKQTGKNQIPRSEIGQIGPFKVGYGYAVLTIVEGPESTPNLKGYVASGNGGQILWILPESQVIIVMTGGNFNNNLSQTQPIDMVMRYIYPAIPK